MSKNRPPKNPIPTPHPPTDLPPTPDDLPPLILQLVNVDVAVLSECEMGEPLTVLWQQNPVPVNLLSGIRVGSVSAADTAQVKQRQVHIGSIITMDPTIALCVVEAH